MSRTSQLKNRRRSQESTVSSNSTSGGGARRLAAGLVVGCFVVGIVGGILVRGRWSSRSADPTVIPQLDLKPPVDKSDDPDRSDSPARTTVPPDSHELRRAEQRFGALFRQGYQEFHRQKYPKALSFFQQAVEAAPHLAEGHYYLGLTFAQLMMLERAEQEYRSALNCNADFPPASEKLCIALHERGAFDEAISHLEAMLAKNPENAFALGELAINLLAQGNPSAAVPLLVEYNRLRGRQAWGLAHLGRAYDLIGNVELAEQNYAEALQFDPKFAIAHHWLGLLQGRNGKTDKSQQSFREYDRLRSLLNLEHQLRMALLRNANDPATLVKLAKIRYELGKPDEALATLNRAHELAPNHLEIQALRRRWSAETD